MPRSRSVSRMGQSRKHAVQRQFHSADANHDGAISRAELAGVFQHLDPSWTRPGLLEKMFDAIDSNHDGKLDVVEFVEWIDGRNVQVKHVQDEMSHDVLRLLNVPCSHDELHAWLTPFGTIKHLHHVQGKTVESIAVFASQAEAKTAFSAFSEKPEEAEQAMAKAKESPDGKLRLGGVLMETSMLCFEGCAPGSVFLTSSACTIGPLQVPSGFFPHFKSAVANLGAHLHGDSSWRIRADKAWSTTETLAQVTEMLRLLSASIDEGFIRKDKEEDLMNWRVTMRVMSRGQLDVMDSARVTDALNELLSFCENDGVKQDQVFMEQDKWAASLQ